MSGRDVLPYPPDGPAEVAGAASRCSRLGGVVERLVRDLAADAGLLQGAWDGPAAQGARAELTSATRLVRRVADPLHRAAGGLRNHADVVADARTEIDALRRAYDDLVAAQQREMTLLVQETDLPGPLRRLLLDETRAGHQAELSTVHRRHEAVLDRVADHARTTARLVADATAGVLPASSSPGAPVADHEADLAALLPLLAAARRAAGVDAGPPAPGAAPDRVRAWWAALTSDEQQRVLLEHAAAVGALDGLSGAARSVANEHRLARDMAMLRARAALTDEERRWLHNCERVREQLDTARAALDPLTLDRLTAQLLVFDPAAFGYEGRAAIVVGDVDTADNVAFLVPGLNSTVGSAMASYTSRALLLHDEARRLSPDTSTATVAWMGYDAPGYSNVAGDDAAEAGADLLVADVLAVQASRVVEPHLTVIGHSYGTTTAGTALRDHETGADDVVLTGSPGPNVDHADELNVPDGHVFVGASSRDPVSYFDRFGLDPTHERFGAVRFRAEDPTRNSWRLDLDDHAKYFNSGTESLRNIAHVVVGQYDGVTVASYREEWFLLPDGINSDPETDREPTPVP